MANYLALINGVPRNTVLPGTSPIYDQSITVVSSGASGSNQINGPVSSGTAITLPSSGTYTINASSIANIEIYLNGNRLEKTFDWTTSGSGPNYTAFVLTMGLVVSDRIDIRYERAS